MYCKECGNQISDDSKFCQHCGSKQTLNPVPKVASETDSEETVFEPDDQPDKENIEPQKEFNFSQTSVLFLGWFLLNLIFLLVFSDGAFDSGNSNGGIGDFWPLSGDDIDEYDITEFLAYVLTPLIIFLMVKLAKSNDKTE